ncbi:MAG: flagellar basal-body rod protein FlgG [Candidatus Margulisbacteria bacterium]|jgi:flagellar basal-body rod protein FlgG|nr:flagellar basal-body rod protein FlgG [Candidatus Margulisiibacteriota bacterium]
MFRQFYIAATGMSAMEKDLITITNNVSNVKTTGFKKARVELETLFPEILEEAVRDTETTYEKGLVELGSGVRVVGTPKDFSSGTVEVTNNSLDIAIEGEGLLKFRMPDGSVAYSRAGNLHKDSDGRIVNISGYPMEPEIRLSDSTTNVLITTGGVVYVQENNQIEQTQVGQIELVRFVNSSSLKSIGGNLYVTTAASGIAIEGMPEDEGFGQIAQFSLESSNVDIVSEMMQMVITQRSFDIISKAIQSGEAMLNSAIEIARG